MILRHNFQDESFGIDDLNLYIKMALIGMNFKHDFVVPVFFIMQMYYLFVKLLLILDILIYACL